MKRYFILAALFCTLGATAQPYRPTEGRDPVRSELTACPTAAEAQAGGTNASKYLTHLTEWSQDDAKFTTHFTVPFAWANRQVLLHMAPASADYEVRVNGKRAVYNANPNMAADFNLTRLVREGKNTLEICLAAPSEAAPLESWKADEPTPSIGQAYIFSQPTMRVRDVTVKTWTVGTAMNAEVGIVVRTSALNPKTSRIYYELKTPQGATAATGHEDLTLDMRREDTLRLVLGIPDTLQWSADRPVRYTLHLKTQYEGRYVEYLCLKLGFRTVRTDHGQLLINGQPVTLRVQEMTAPPTSSDLRQLKDEGYNALRLRPGILPEGLYGLCDSLGIYVIAQAPLDTRRSGSDIRRGGNPTNDPAWLGAYLERTTDTYHAAQRHPSVVAFSLAEKSANGINLYESYLNLKKQGDSRPVVYPDAGGEWNNDPLHLAPHSPQQ